MLLGKTLDSIGASAEHFLSRRARLGPKIARGEAMSARSKGVLAMLAVAAVMVFGAGGASGATPFPLFGPDGGARCDGSGITNGDDLGFGFATISGDATVRATVIVEGLTPNFTYSAKLIQGEGDCGVTDATFVTNKHGHGQVTLTETSVSDNAHVVIWDDQTAVDFYVTETYFH